MKKKVLALAVMLAGANFESKALMEGESRLELVRQEVTVEEVVQNYIAAVGGQEMVDNLRNLEMVMKADIQGMSLNITVVTDQENERALNLTEMNGNQVAKTLIKDGKGKVISMGQEQEINGDQLKSMMSQTYIIPEMHYVDLGYEISYDGTGEVDGEEAHKLLLKDTNGVETREYYSVESGLKLMTESELAGRVVYEDYKDWDGITLPSKITMSNNMMPMPMEVNVISLKMNQELDDQLFN
ncbi:peptidase, M16 family protein [Echinicola shivajiensis]|uniref:peptidase, M16 family protein n=1 Tax=Echinicola shivajiensis TaxID=1035916 RepID=UPI001BFC583A|nr:peptidase, M16 family protein [Echinicola shivajiensis]